MDLLAAWLLYPLALALLCVGLALLVERAAGWRLPGELLAPVGLTTLLALAQLITSRGDTAQLALPLIGALAVAGLLVVGGALAYALGALDAALPDDWEIVPLLKVGEDLAGRARDFLRTLRHLAPEAAAIAVPATTATANSAHGGW